MLGGFSDEGDESLSALAKAVMKELQDSLDGNDLSAVRKSIAKFSLPESRGGLGGNVPKSLKLAAIDALRWFDSKGLLAGGGEAGAGGDSSDMKEELEFYTDMDITTVNGVRQWKTDNPDDEFDAEFYGGQSDK